MRIAKPGSIARVERIEARAYRIPTRTPEADGTLSWEKTTLVLVNAEAGGAMKRNNIVRPTDEVPKPRLIISKSASIRRIRLFNIQQAFQRISSYSR